MRLFIALLFPDEVKDALLDAAEDLRRNTERGVFSRRENFHLTLAFLGEQRDPKPAGRAMEAAVGAPFSLRLDRPGRFRRDGGDIWWVGLKDSPPLTALHRRLSEALAREGFEVENRPFRPHVTLGRQVVLTDPGFRPSVPPLAIPARELCLMRSDRVSGVLTYTCICKAEMK